MKRSGRMFSSPLLYYAFDSRFPLLSLMVLEKLKAVTAIS
jgi:hypothetical protein